MKDEFEFKSPAARLAVGTVRGVIPKLAEHRKSIIPRGKLTKEQIDRRLEVAKELREKHNNPAIKEHQQDHWGK